MADRSSETLTSGQEALQILESFVISPVGFVNGIVLCWFMLRLLYCSKTKTTRNNNKYYRYAAISATISIFCSLPNFFVVIFLANDAVFPLSFGSEVFVDFIDIDLVGTFIIGKIAYYMAFSFHVQSILFENRYHSPSRYLNFWTVFVSVLVLGCGLWVIIDITMDPSELSVGSSDRTGIRFLVPSASSNSGSDWVRIHWMNVQNAYKFE